MVLILSGCSAFPCRPDNRVIPTVSFAARMNSWNSTNQGKSVEWMKQFCEELNNMDGWAPPTGWFTDLSVLQTNMECVIKQWHYPLSLTNNVRTVFNKLHNAGEYFFLDSSVDEPGLSNFVSTNAPKTPFMSAAGIDSPSTNTGSLPGKLNLVRLAADMLLRIDDEHKALFKPGKYNKSDRGVRLFSASPRMVSLNYPVGVSLTVVNPPEGEKSSEKTNTLPLVIINNYLNGAPSTGTNSSSKENKLASINPVVDFNSNPDVTLSLSTVLNSADVLDRIEYVSTFIYIYPYPQPPNGDVSLDDEFLKAFFARQLPRLSGKAREEATQADLAGSFDRMRVRFRNVTTTVVTKDLNLGTVNRTAENDLSAILGASIPVAPATVNPSINVASKVTGATSFQILKQLDQRSAYVSSDGAFLRITQRGMSSVNLNGRFNEQVQLYIPPAADPLYVIEPTTEESGSPKSQDTNSNTLPKAATAPKLGFQIKALAEPLYSRVDALVVSVVVARHPTQLRRSTQETFGLSLEDAADEDFIVGLARPAKVQLWRADRTLDRIYTADLDFTTTNNVQIYFDSPSMGFYEAKPLRLAGFDDTQQLEFIGKISRAIRTGLNTNTPTTLTNTPTTLIESQDPLSSLVICKKLVQTNYCISVTDTNTGIMIRLGQQQNNGELTGFSSLESFFPSYNTDKTGNH
jgi:hypothetical protein